MKQIYVTLGVSYDDKQVLEVHVDLPLREVKERVRALEQLFKYQWYEVVLCENGIPKRQLRLHADPQTGLRGDWDKEWEKL